MAITDVIYIWSYELQNTFLKNSITLKSKLFHSIEVDGKKVFNLLMFRESSKVFYTIVIFVGILSVVLDKAFL